MAKTEHDTRMDVISYAIDLTTERVLIARKNFLTALHRVFSTDIEGRPNLRN